ncbi:uncharacterized protein LOC126661927 [Mercurialis annua]|uniref:uncharacterized protein LOC126661927 n=1 Tax=Mercurialis annua TaxID=3986 RepID=UPI00215F4D34|nr:uncharacterized protein LOC126661927 [Mercurialis annua]
MVFIMASNCDTLQSPPGMCRNDEFMFLIVLVPRPRNPKQQMDVFLHPLIVKLNQLWEFGVKKFNVHNRQNFQLKAALIWTINDFSYYSMLSGWSTSMRLACPHCMENTDAFLLTERVCECKRFRQLKTGEKLLAQVDSLGFMKAYEIAKDPGTGRFSKATYALDRDKKKALFEWIKLIEFPYGYVSNLSICVDPIEEDLKRMRLHIPKILCKMQRIFPPNFFDSMEHLLIPSYDGKAVSVRSGNKYLRELEKKVTNKGREDGSISSGYLQEETAKFAAYYFSEGDPMIPERLQRNEVSDIEVNDYVDKLSIFKPHRQPVGACRKKYLEDDEIIVAQTYVLLNCPEIENYREVFEAELRVRNPKISNLQIEAKFKIQLSVPIPSFLVSQRDLFRSVRTFKGYCVNGLKFQTQAYGEEQLTMNSGVCIKGTQYVESENDFYVVQIDIIELEYPTLPMKTIVLFKCERFDPTQNSGTISNKYNIVYINNRKRYNKYEPFILAEQADQVHYLPYPEKK